MSKRRMAKRDLAWLPGDIYVNEADLDLDWREVRHLFVGTLVVILFVLAIVIAGSGS